MLRVFFLTVYFIQSSFGWFQFSTLPTRFSKKTTPPPDKILKKTCLLVPDSGPCRAGIPMYYFNPESMNCSIFSWGGCQGNGNRYKTFDDCYNSCKATDDWKPGRPRWCSLTFDYGYCFGGETRYYYDRLYKVCKQTIYSGCGGNKNNFYSKEQCDEICRFGNQPIVASTKKRWDGLKKVLIVNPWHASSKKTADVTKGGGPRGNNCTIPGRGGGGAVVPTTAGTTESAASESAASESAKPESAATPPTTEAKANGNGNPSPAPDA